MLQYTLKRIIITITATLLIASGVRVYAYWVEGLKTPSPLSTSIEIIVGEFTLNTHPPFDGILQLDPMTEEELKQTIPDDTLFMYQGRLYINRPSSNYTPAWHGMPGEPDTEWAMYALDLEWMPNTNYRNNSVVAKNDKYYITNTNHNNNWFITDPETDGSHWLEIEPISEEHFGYLEGTSLRDYRTELYVLK